jgi:hypothetical protein
MKLTVLQCIDILKKPRNLDLIVRAKKQEQRLAMHCEPVITQWRAGAALADYLRWVGSFLPADKFQRFQQLLTYPLETVDTTESIFDELSKFFDAPDADTRIEFTSPAYEEDFRWFMDEIAHDDDFWRDQAFKALQTEINSFIVVDLPREQLTSRPEPYISIVRIESIYDAILKERTGEPEYLVYWVGERTVVFLDELAYRIFEKQDDQVEWVMTFEAIHSTYRQTVIGTTTVYGEVIDGLGYVPACPFWRHVINKENLFDKKGPLTAALGKLDWLLFWRTSKKYLDLYGAWPIIVTYKDECEYKDEQGNICEAGYINYMQGETRCQKRCPVCEAKGIIGPGSFWKVDPPQDKNDVDLLQNPVKIIEVSNDKLEYGYKEIERLEQEVFLNTVGYMNTNQTKEAINERQVKSLFESRETILDRIREQFDQNRKFALDTMAKLRYGNSYLRAEVFGGREYFLQSGDDIIRRYGDAKKAGLPQYEISRLRDAYSKTMFKNNAVQYQRAIILSQLEPYADYTPQELKDMGIDVIDPLGFYLKIHFVNYVSRFEREQMSVIEFGSAIPFASKISIINDKLLDYVKESIRKNADAPPITRPEPGGNGGSANRTATGA